VTEIRRLTQGLKILDKIQWLLLFLFRCLNLFVGIVHCTREVYLKCSLCSIGAFSFNLVTVLGGEEGE